MKRIFISIGLMVALLVFIQGTTTKAIAQIFEYKGITTYKERFAPGEVLVKFKIGASETAIQELNSKFRVNVRRVIPRIAARRLTLPKGAAVMDMVNKFRSSPLVEYAEPNYYVHAFMIPNDEYYQYQWHLYNAAYGGIQMENAWGIQTGDPSVIVGIIDTGVAYENYGKGRKRYYLAPDLANTNFVPGYDFVEDDTHPNDDNSHGTHVCGTVAQSSNNTIGVAGIAFNTTIMPIKVWNQYGSGSHAQMADGFHYAADNGAHIINYSGGGVHSTTKENAVIYARNAGVIIVAAAGNAYTTGNAPSYPAAYDDYVIAVGLPIISRLTPGTRTPALTLI